MGFRAEVIGVLIFSVCEIFNGLYGLFLSGEADVSSIRVARFSGAILGFLV